MLESKTARFQERNNMTAPLAGQLYACTTCRIGREKDVSLTRVQGESALACPACGVSYPVRGGIPRFVPADNYANSFGYQWNIHRATQLDSYTGLALSRDRLMTATHWPDRLDGIRVLEAGSGAGRFTEVIAAMGAEVCTFDLSSAIDANKSNNGLFSNVHFAQGDIFNIPFHRFEFDHVVCLGVIQHTPEPERAFQSLARHVKPGGQLTIDCYPKTFKGVVSWKYILRPITTRIEKELLYSIIERWAPRLIPVSIILRRLFGKFGSRLLPILEYDHWGIERSVNKLWCVLDTFDMYSPEYDLPQTAKTVRRWYDEAGFIDVHVGYGLNGVVARGMKPVRSGPFVS